MVMPAGLPVVLSRGEKSRMVGSVWPASALSIFITPPKTACLRSCYRPAQSCCELASQVGGEVGFLKSQQDGLHIPRVLAVQERGHFLIRLSLHLLSLIQGLLQSVEKLRIFSGRRLRDVLLI